LRQPAGTPTHSPVGFGFGTGAPQLSQKNLRYPGGRSTTGSSNKRMRFLPKVKREPWTAARTIAAYADPVDVLHRLQWQSSNGAMIEVGFELDSTAQTSAFDHRLAPVSGRLTWSCTARRSAALEEARRLAALRTSAMLDVTVRILSYRAHTLLPTASLVKLNGRAFHVTERTKYTAITLPRAQQFVTLLAFIEEDASIGGHQFFRLGAARRTGNY